MLTDWTERWLPPPRRAQFAVAGILILQGFIAWQNAYPTLHRRTLLAVVALVAALLLPLARMVVEGPARAVVARFVTASFGIVVLFGIVGPGDPSAAATLAAAQLAGWIVALLAVAGGLPPQVRGRVPSAKTLARAGAASAVFALGLLALAHWAIGGGRPIIVDETLYLLQARLLREPSFVRSIDGILEPCFTIPLAMIADGRLVTQFAPGWPSVLLAFRLIGLQWWTGPVIGAGAVGLTYVLGSRLRSRPAGLLAAGLVALNMWFVQWAGTYMAHAADTFLALLAATLLERAGRLQTLRDGALGVVAGAVLGALVATRPLTGAAVAISLWCWVIVRSARSVSTGMRLSLALAAGALPIFILLFGYNAVTTGDPFTFGYVAVNGDLSRMGFGMRGVVDYGPDGRFLDAAQFTVRVAMANATARLADASTTVLASGLLIPLLLVGHRFRFRIRTTELACFAVLPVMHFFYYWSDNRFYIVLLPFVFIEIGACLAHIYQRAPFLGRRLIMAIATGSAALLTTTLMRRHDDLASIQRVYGQVSQLRGEFGRVLVFIDTPPTIKAYVYRALYAFNVEDFPGSVIVARHRGAHDGDLIARFPYHRPFLVRVIDEHHTTPPEPLLASDGLKPLR